MNTKPETQVPAGSAANDPLVKAWVGNLKAMEDAGTDPAVAVDMMLDVALARLLQMHGPYELSALLLRVCMDLVSGEQIAEAVAEARKAGTPKH